MAAVSEPMQAPAPLLAHIERFVRLITTAVSFAVFGIGGLALAVSVFPLLVLLIWDQHKRAAIAQAIMRRLFAFYVRLMRAMGTLSFDVDHPEILRSLRGTIVVANHPSLLDAVFLMAFIPRTRALVKADVWRNPFMRGVVLAARYIPHLNDAEKLMSDCAGALKDGDNLVIFPEGSRTPGSQLRRFQKGFANVALLAGAPIQVVTIEVSPPTLRKNEPWYRVAPTRAHWTIRVHERIDTVRQYGNDRVPGPVRRLTTDVASRIEGLLRA